MSCLNLTLEAVGQLLKRQGYTSREATGSQPVIAQQVEGEILQYPSRCPRCGYPLRYERGAYVCEFCGFPRTKSPLLNSIRNFEREVRSKVDTWMERSRARRYERMIVQYPYTSRQQACVSCRLRIPQGAQSCPYCGAPQVIPQPPQEKAPPSTPLDPFDQQVLDYIAARNGTISISQAARDLSMEPGALRLRIERLKSSGLIRTA